MNVGGAHIETVLDDRDKQSASRCIGEPKKALTECCVPGSVPRASQVITHVIFGITQRFTPVLQMTKLTAQGG